MSRDGVPFCTVTDFSNVHDAMRGRCKTFGMRYFFDLIGATLGKDHVGTEYENDSGACQEARLRALNGESHRLQTYNGFHSICIRDETDRVVLTVAIRH